MPDSISNRRNHQGGTRAMTKRRKVFLAFLILFAAQLACNDCDDWIAVGSDAYRDCNSETTQ